MILKKCLLNSILALLIISPLASYANPYSWLKEQAYKMSGLIKVKTVAAAITCANTAKNIWFSYNPIIARKMRYQEQVARYTQSIAKLDRQNTESEQFQEDLKRWQQSSSQCPNNNHRRYLTHSKSLLNFLTNLKNNETNIKHAVYSPGQIYAALNYLSDSLQNNMLMYDSIALYDHIVMKPYEGYDYTTGQQIIDQQALLDYESRVDYQGNDIAAGRIISTKDIPLIKRYNNADEFFEMNQQSEGYQLKKENNQAAYEEHKKGITFFNKDKYNSYQGAYPDITREYFAQQEKFKEENKKFRNRFIDDQGVEHKGWIATLKEKKDSMEREQKRSAKRWYLW